VSKIKKVIISSSVRLLIKIFYIQVCMKKIMDCHRHVINLLVPVHKWNLDNPLSCGLWLEPIVETKSFYRICSSLKPRVLMIHFHCWFYTWTDYNSITHKTNYANTLMNNALGSLEPLSRMTIQDKKWRYQPSRPQCVKHS
jgi:hypothetical protein